MFPLSAHCGQQWLWQHRPSALQIVKWHKPSRFLLCHIWGRGSGESPPRLSEKVRTTDDDTVICRSSFSARSKSRTGRRQSVISPVPRRDGYNTLDFVPKSCASRSLWTPSSGHFPPPTGAVNDPAGVRYVR